MTIDDFVARGQQCIEQTLDRLVPPESENPATIHKAMRYSLFAGGKRIRPLLAIAAANAVADATPGIEAAACSLELIHTYSLIHDDLPALDNDDLRRGRPTCHKVFGDAMAILAGDALLLTLAFEVLAKLDAPAERRIDLVHELSTASGTVGGMIGGQVNDIEGEGKSSHPMDLLESIHRAKTGALLRASVRMGAIYAAPTRVTLTLLRSSVRTSASRSRSWMMCWTSRSPPNSSARLRARMPRSTRSHSPQSMESSARARWPSRNVCPRISRIRTLWRPRRPPARTGRPHREPQHVTESVKTGIHRSFTVAARHQRSRARKQAVSGGSSIQTCQVPNPRSS